MTEFDSEAIISMLSKVRKPEEVGLGDLINQTTILSVYYQNLVYFPKEANADKESLKNALEFRLNSLYDELNKREKRYLGNFDR